MESTNGFVKMYAVSGDLSANGMSKTATEISVSSEAALAILAYQSLSDACFFVAQEHGIPTEVMETLMSLNEKNINKIKESGVFKNKYYWRTKWDIVK